MGLRKLLRYSRKSKFKASQLSQKAVSIYSFLLPARFMESTLWRAGSLREASPVGTGASSRCARFCSRALLCPTK